MYPKTVITGEETDEVASSAPSEVLIADLSLHRLRQQIPYANAELIRAHFQLKKAPFVLSCYTVRDQGHKISINLVS